MKIKVIQLNQDHELWCASLVSMSGDEIISACSTLSERDAEHILEEKIIKLVENK